MENDQTSQAPIIDAAAQAEADAKAAAEKAQALAPTPAGSPDPGVIPPGKAHDEIQRKAIREMNEAATAGAALEDTGAVR